MDEDTAEMDMTFTVVEVDLEYEFDAARCFDFTREETPAEAREAELWFESAGTYPPSPFVRRLILREDMLQETLNTSQKYKDAVTMAVLDNESNAGAGKDSYAMETNERDGYLLNGETLSMLQSGSLQKFQNKHTQLPTGLTFNNHVTKDATKAKTKSSINPRYLRTSTLMKPTASQLAKQNQPHKVADTRNLLNPFAVEVQAAKRQKLEGGLMHKVPELKQQSNFVHKAPKREATADGFHTNLKITVPREPELGTANRAQRTRAKETSEPECTAFRRFKALPLNRKILEAPSVIQPKRTIPRLPEFQEFHLMTSKRATQHGSSVLLSSGSSGCIDKVPNKPGTNAFARSTNGGPKRLNSANASEQGGYDFVHNFKARPLNKKIFSSKGDIGVFRNTKKDATVPSEFNFQTDKRSQHCPPVELFDKLSLADLHSNAVSLGKPPHTLSIQTKGPKENRASYFLPEHEMKSNSKETLTKFCEKQPQSGRVAKNTKIRSTSLR